MMRRRGRQGGSSVDSKFSSLDFISLANATFQLFCLLCVFVLDFGNVVRLPVVNYEFINFRLLEQNFDFGSLGYLDCICLWMCVCVSVQPDERNRE